MSEALSDREQDTEPSKITSKNVEAEIQDFFNNRWDGSNVPNVDIEDNDSVDRFLAFIGPINTEFTMSLYAAGEDPEKLAAVSASLRKLSDEISSMWEAEVNRSDDVLAEFVANLPEPEDDKTSGISSGESVLPLDCENPFEGLNLS